MGLSMETLLWTAEHSSICFDWLNRSSFHFGRDLRTNSGKLFHVMGLTTSWMSLCTNFDSASDTLVLQEWRQRSYQRVSGATGGVMCPGGVMLQTWTTPVLVPLHLYSCVRTHTTHHNTRTYNTIHTRTHTDTRTHTHTHQRTHTHTHTRRTHNGAPNPWGYQFPSHHNRARATPVTPDCGHRH